MNKFEKKLNQKAKSIWLTGLSGSGKTTIAVALEKELFQLNYLCTILDGDDVRKTINNDLNFTLQDRKENIRRIAEINKIFLNTGIIVINCFVSPTIEIINLAKEIIGKENFIEVFVNCSIEECERRDVKQLYNKAKNGTINNFTGINSPYEPPLQADVTLNTDKLDISETVSQLKAYILNEIKVK